MSLSQALFVMFHGSVSPGRSSFPQNAATAAAEPGRCLTDDNNAML